MKIHEKYINRCIQLAKNAVGKTYPNPLVGSVLVYKNEIIGEGWHQQAGKPHAEVNAINSVENKKLLKKATIYVSLEPCSHFGKTPPCSDLIIEKGIKKVVIGTMDPFAKVAGRGIQKLMNAGCEVVLGVLEKECQELNKRFFTFHQKKRPYIILKWAQTKDGFIAPLQQNERKPVWISNEKSKQLVHKWRSEEQAILVGTNTAIKDNPKLNTRLVEGKNPTRIAIDRSLKIPKNSYLFDGSIPTIIITENSSAKNQENLTFISIDFKENIPQQICDHLYQQELQSLIIEGGQQTLQSFIDKNLWDEARVFTGSTFLEEGIKAPTFVGNKISSEEIGDNNLSIYKND
ncbi:bifunctional diaminohydroxyphosphoribosylaminopyrimidine deaminase/5-amino-6-(5-phosphoribosylamino)uracil reductase RibD [Mesonia aquimarina]|uniref:bifunctional diaminohydroxyphosphoribosylaminopyrimidine deaminase/5-amino-6-(5-phosphoribosylamino)uracil reductase RibD n=1 Tax=Mesonia aquimarina TaxID=1504967 RepID=UPI000EF5986C|nr:bifunctional diaminohydroxyphosphoribosylaminopyrimidine deaminase/5-amino-6-(5-phosphoribosylamino)uracil reductase RibD [Mesonia aquimarina]